MRVVEVTVDNLFREGEGTVQAAECEQTRVAPMSVCASTWIEYRPPACSMPPYAHGHSEVGRDHAVRRGSRWNAEDARRPSPLSLDRGQYGARAQRGGAD